MYDKSIGDDDSTPASAPRCSHLRTALLALPVIGLAIAVANIPTALAFYPHHEQRGANTTAKTGIQAAQLATDAVERASQNRNIAASRFDPTQIYSDADEELFNESATVWVGADDDVIDDSGLNDPTVGN